jgi:hypothetical protein
MSIVVSKGCDDINAAKALHSSTSTDFLYQLSLTWEIGY